MYIIYIYIFFLLFLGPFTDHNVCQLMITNTSSDYVGFKMKCTAAKYYTSNPAVGIVPPEGLTCISGIYVI